MLKVGACRFRNIGLDLVFKFIYYLFPNCFQCGFKYDSSKISFSALVCRALWNYFNLNCCPTHWAGDLNLKVRKGSIQRMHDHWSRDVLVREVRNDCNFFSGNY